jgi:hypothetical protein
MREFGQARGLIRSKRAKTSSPLNKGSRAINVAMAAVDREIPKWQCTSTCAPASNREPKARIAAESSRVGSFTLAERSMASWNRSRSSLSGRQVANAGGVRLLGIQN